MSDPTEPQDTDRHRCGHEGCTAEGNPCWLPDWNEEQGPDREPDDWYCVLHAHGAGYCWGCGLFWGGVESFEFLNRSALCDNCQQQADAEEGGWEEDWGAEWGDEHGLDCQCDECYEAGIETTVKLDTGLGL